MSRILQRIGSPALLLLGVAGLLVLWRGRTPLEVESVEVILDTLRYEAVEPVAVEPVSVERLEDEMLYTYRDTAEGRWSAEVVGRDVELRSLVIVDKCEREQLISRTHPEWEVALRSSINSHGRWYGVGVNRRWGRASMTLEAGYDPTNESPYVGVAASFTLWSEWR